MKPSLSHMPLSAITGSEITIVTENLMQTLPIFLKGSILWGPWSKTQIQNPLKGLPTILPIFFDSAYHRDHIQSLNACSRFPKEVFIAQLP